MLDNFFKSGYKFKNSESEMESRFQMINIALLLSSFGVLYGLIGNISDNRFFIIFIESMIITVNVILVIILRYSYSSFSIVSKIITAQYAFFFLYLFYFFGPNDLKFLWIFTYPVMLLYIQNLKSGIYWLLFVLLMINISSFQSLVEIQFNTHQVNYISVVLLIISSIIYFYKQKMTQAREIISQQRLNLQNKYLELSKKDKMISTQSRQAVMGEMMSMIAHQWRQPLHTVTLQISNLQFDKLLGKDIDGQKLDNTLIQINDTLVYLSETIDDFQTYFHPNKIKNKVEIHELLQKSINFIQPRIKSTNINIKVNKDNNINVVTYENELIQIILNLLNNAIDAFQDLVQEDKKISMNAKVNGEYLDILVIDNASGILMNNIDKVFEPYFSTKGKNGTGLGLYMSKMIVQKQFDGDLTVTSSSFGSSFLVKIKKDVNF